MGGVLFASRAEQMVRESFMEFINRQEMNQRIMGYAIYDNYYHGDQGEMLPSSIAEQLRDPQSATVNYCKAVVDIATRFIAGTASNPNSLSIDVTEQVFDRDRIIRSKTPTAVEAQRQLNRIYKESGMFDTEFVKLVRMMIKKGDAFMKLVLIGQDENRDIRIRVKRPGVIYPRYRDDDYMEMLYAATKWFTMNTPSQRQWWAEVHRPAFIDPETGEEVPGMVEIYDLGPQGVESDKTYQENSEGELRAIINRPLHADAGSAIPEMVAEYESGFDDIPIYHVKNNVDDLEFGVSDLLSVIPLQNNLNRIVSDMLYALDYNGFPRGFVMGAQGDGPMDVGPAVWTKVHDPSANVIVIPPANIGHFVHAIEVIIDFIAGVSSTPKQAFAEYSHGLPTSGYALRVRYQPLEDKCNEKRAELKMAFRRMNRQILRVLSEIGAIPEESLGRLEVDVYFGGGLPSDKLMDAQLYGLYKQYNWMSDRSIQERIEIENPDEENAQIDRERYAEAVLFFQAELEAKRREESESSDGSGTQED